MVVSANSSANLQSEMVIPSQPSNTGALIVSLVNRGPIAVTIESVQLAAQQLPAALSSDGAPTYTPLAGNNPHVTSASHVVAGAAIRPGESILIRIPFRTAACWLPASSILHTFAVTTRFMVWSHRLDVSWTGPNDHNNEAIVIHHAATSRNPAGHCSEIKG